MSKILIVDDSKLVRFSLSKLFKELGHEIVGLAEDGLIGYDMYKEYLPDLVMLDINMPNLSGFKTVEKIILDYPNAKIIMVSAMDDRTIVYECIGLGALDYLNKPFTKETLKEKISFLDKGN